MVDGEAMAIEGRLALFRKNAAKTMNQPAVPGVPCATALQEILHGLH